MLGRLGRWKSDANQTKTSGLIFRAMKATHSTANAILNATSKARAVSNDSLHLYRRTFLMSLSSLHALRKLSCCIDAGGIAATNCKSTS
jgi:hypothetical protein